jgi:hypothetical protein
MLTHGWDYRTKTKYLCMVGAQKRGVSGTMVSQRGLWRLRICSRHGSDLAHERLRRFTDVVVAHGHCGFATLLFSNLARRSRRRLEQ